MNRLCLYEPSVVAFFILLIVIYNTNTCLEIYEETERSEDEHLITHTATSEQFQKSTFRIPDEKWTTKALRDLAYYLRNHKFNEWDRRYHQNRPRKDLVGYFSAFPSPALRSLHWKVFENCDNSFYKCITYLYSVIEIAPLTRNGDTAVIINEKSIPLNDTLIENLNIECRNVLRNSEKNSMPFDSLIEKFQWSTSASYYMCWYTMLGTPALSMLGEACDNFANCLDKQFGYQNRDPRSDDRLSFACALYSFCPDPCCPLRHIKTLVDCNNNEANPCFIENADGDPLDKQCKMNRNDNQNLRDIIANKWNVSCNCKERGFIWKSQFGMCVDVNECFTGEHNCSDTSEDCLNLPGTFQCICKWGYAYSNEEKRCINIKLFTETNNDLDENYYSIMDKIKDLLKYFGVK